MTWDISDSVVVLDFETYTDAASGYTLKRMSTWDYIQDERFDILSAAIVEGGGPAVFYHKLGSNGDSLTEARKKLAAAASGRLLVAHNLNFEGLILKHVWGIEFSRMLDTAGYLRYLGMRAALKNGGHLVGMEKEGAPQFTDEALRNPERRRRFARYNAIDTLIAKRIFERTVEDEGFTDLEWYICHRNAEENLRGLRVDGDGARILACSWASARARRLQKFCTDYPAFDTGALNNLDAVRKFCKRKFDVDLKTTAKKAREVAEAKRSNPSLARFLEDRDAIRSLGVWSKNVNKIADRGERIYCALKYFGAHTGRFTGSGKEASRINIQSMPKGEDSELPELAEYRHILIADEDESWVGCDLSTIEPRVTALLAGQTDLLDQFRAGEDVYIWFGGLVFPGVEIIKGGLNNTLRKICKLAVIGLGYAMGKRTFVNGIVANTPETDPALIGRVYDMYQGRFARIGRLRKAFWKAFCYAADDGMPANVGRCHLRRIHDCTGTGVTVEVKLPTGRSLYYRSIEKRRVLVDNERVPQPFWAWDYQYAKRFELAPLGDEQTIEQLRTPISLPTLIENIVQAVSRDLLMAQQREIEQHPRLRVRFSVHDELVVSTPRCHCPRRDDALPEATPVEELHEPDCPWVAGRQVVGREMSCVPDCFPELADLPVACELSDNVRDHYGV